MAKITKQNSTGTGMLFKNGERVCTTHYSLPLTISSASTPTFTRGDAGEDLPETTGELICSEPYLVELGDALLLETHDLKLQLECLGVLAPKRYRIRVVNQL